MLLLNTRFALLAAFCSLATLTFSLRWGVGAAVIQSRSFNHRYCHNVTSDRPSAQYVLSLPPQSKAKQFKVRTHEWLYFNPVALFADIALTRLKRDGSTPRVGCKFRKRGDYSDPAEIARRSVLIPNNHGSEYVVSHSRQPVVQGRRRPKVRMLIGMEETPLSRRAQDAIVGNVVLMSPVHGSATGRQIAAIFAAPNGPGAWTLYASETNQTQFQLVQAPANVESNFDLIPVMLEMGAPGETRTCATYNSKPAQDESDMQDENMTMEPCADRATPEMGHKSQIFMYNDKSGMLEPTWNSGADGANTTADISPVNQNSTTSSNPTAASSAVQAAATLFANREDIPPNPMKQNSTVTLVFRPVKAMVADVGTVQDSTTTGMTMTKTKTVTVFNAGSTSAGVSSSTSNTASQVTATSSVLDVQLVGAPMPSTGSTTTMTSMSTLSSTATGSIDAAAIASRIAASASASSASAASTAGSSTAVSSSTDNASPSSTQAARRRADGRLGGSDSKLTTVSTEPYSWIFRAEER